MAAVALEQAVVEVVAPRAARVLAQEVEVEVEVVPRGAAEGVAEPRPAEGAVELALGAAGPPPWAVQLWRLPQAGSVLAAEALLSPWLALRQAPRSLA